MMRSRLLIAALIALVAVSPSHAQWDKTKPPTGGGLVSADIRNNWAALEAALHGLNLLRDPGLLIWPQPSPVSSSALVKVGHWNIAPLGGGTAATLTRTGTGLTDTNRKVGKFATKVTGGSGGGALYQHVLPSADYDDGFDGAMFSYGAWVRCTVGSTGRLRMNFGNGAPVHDDFHTGSGSWEWMSMSATVPADAVHLMAAFDVLGASQSCHISGPTFIFGGVPPAGFIPTQPHVGTTTRFMAGSQSIGNDKIGLRVIFDRPVIVRSVAMVVHTGVPVGSALILDVNQFSGGSQLSMYATKPQISVSGSASAPAQPDGATYERRCFNEVNATDLSYALVTMDLDAVGSTTAAIDLYVTLHYLYFPSPLEPFLAALSLS